MVTVMSSVIYFLFFNAELSTINYPIISLSSATSKAISKLKKEKKVFICSIHFKNNRPECHKINKTWQHYKIFVYM